LSAAVVILVAFQVPSGVGGVADADADLVGGGAEAVGDPTVGVVVEQDTLVARGAGHAHALPEAAHLLAQQQVAVALVVVGDAAVAHLHELRRADRAHGVGRTEGAVEEKVVLLGRALEAPPGAGLGGRGHGGQRGQQQHVLRARSCSHPALHKC
jgi:hypothetical protein